MKAQSQSLSIFAAVNTNYLLLRCIADGMFSENPVCTCQPNSIFFPSDAVVKGNELEFGQSLHKLQQEPVFHLRSFEKEIDRIKSRIAEVNSLRLLDNKIPTIPSMNIYRMGR